MMNKLVRWFIAAAGLAIASWTAAPAMAQETETVEEDFQYYDYYEGGYEEDFGDDWFYDYYDYEADAYDGYYDYYGDYDYDADVFDWEEDGLFD